MFLRVRVNNYLYICVRVWLEQCLPAFTLLSSLSVCMYLTYVYTCVVRVSVYACRCVYAKENGVTSVEIATCDRLCVEIRWNVTTLRASSHRRDDSSVSFSRVYCARARARVCVCVCVCFVSLSFSCILLVSSFFFFRIFFSFLLFVSLASSSSLIAIKTRWKINRQGSTRLIEIDR